MNLFRSLTTTISINHFNSYFLHMVWLHTILFWSDFIRMRAPLTSSSYTTTKSPSATCYIYEEKKYIVRTSHWLFPIWLYDTISNFLIIISPLWIISHIISGTISWYVKKLKDIFPTSYLIYTCIIRHCIQYQHS